MANFEKILPLLSKVAEKKEFLITVNCQVENIETEESVTLLASDRSKNLVQKLIESGIENNRISQKSKGKLIEQKAKPAFRSTTEIEIRIL